MFKGKVKIYKNIDGKEERVFKSFDNEKDFNAFIEKNQDLKDFQKWDHLKWWDSMFDIKWFFDDAKRIGDMSFFKEMQDNLEKMLEETKKLLWKGK